MTNLLHTGQLMPSRRRFIVYISLASFFLLAGCKTTNSSNAATQDLPILGKVPDFSFTNQNGVAFGSEQLSGSPYIAAFMFTRCPSICPRLTAVMKEVDEAMLKASVDLQLISISVDPEHDTPIRLLDYAKKYKADPQRWNFLTGDFQVIARTAEEGFKVGVSGTVDPQKPHLGITHASHLILVDKHNNIRGYFRTSDNDVTDQLLSAAKKL